MNSQITVYSAFSSYIRVNFRLDHYGDHCAWVKHSTDTSPWVKFDFLQNHVAVGVGIGEGCDVSWSHIGTDVLVVYEGIANWWFDMEISARYWRIEPVDFILYGSIQADFIEYE